MKYNYNITVTTNEPDYEPRFAFFDCTFPFLLPWHDHLIL